MGVHNILNRRIAYPNQSYDGITVSPSNQQTVVHSIAAYNGTTSMNDLGVGYTLNSTRFNSSFSGTSYLIRSATTFDMAAFLVGTPDTSGSTFAVQYWNGTSFVPLMTISSPTLTATGATAILFAPPLDWVKDANGFYSIRITASGTPNYTVTGLKICEILAFREKVLSYGTLQVRFETRQKLLQQGAEIIAYFSTPSQSNRVEISYQNNP